MSEHSTELWSRAQRVIPGGVNSPVRSFRGVGGAPVFFERGLGPYVYDTEDKSYIDYVSSWGPHILGHSHPAVVEAVQAAVALSLGFGAPTRLEVEMAEMLTRLMPNLEQVRLVNSGTEAAQTAIRLARGITGRDKILKFQGGYHGHVDSLLVKAGSGQLTFGLPDSPGIPASLVQHTLNLPFNDIEAVEQCFATLGEQLAAVIVEPVAGNMNCVLPKPGFLASLRKLCTEYGALLIFDEVITGFRVALGGAQHLYDIRPDLTCLGKIIGGGLPIAGFGGARKWMEHLAPKGAVYQAGTLSGNPIAVTAGLATLKELMKPGVYQHLDHLTQTLMQGLSALAKRFGIPFKTQGIGGLWGFFFTKAETISNCDHVMQSSVPAFQHFFHAMLKRGVYFAPSAFEAAFMSLSHTPKELDFTLAQAEAVFKSWPKGISER